MSPRTAIVTGAASGIGLACARAMLAEGTRIAAVDVRADALRQAFGDAGEQVVSLTADIGDPDACHRVVAEAVARLGGIDALLHFAAAWTGSSWEQSDAAEWDRILGINLKGAFFLTKAVAQHMVERGSGAIVLTASDSAKVGGVAGGPAYCASKGGIIALTHSLARALGPRGVRVNAINPGVVDTPMTSGWPPEIKAGALALTPLGRLAKPDDVADVACFLASEKARFITGEVIEVNGGFYFD